LIDLELRRGGATKGGRDMLVYAPMPARSPRLPKSLKPCGEEDLASFSLAPIDRCRFVKGSSARLREEER
jgi:hypothetical protein